MSGSLTRFRPGEEALELLTHTGITLHDLQRATDLGLLLRRSLPALCLGRLPVSFSLYIGDLLCFYLFVIDWTFR